jgi:HD-like signal output (HDOD) protein
MEDPAASVLISTESLLQIAQTFPSTPQILAELGLLLRNPNVEMEDIALQLKRDPTLAARLIRLANSAAFTQTEPVAAIETAVTLAGFQEVHRLVGIAMLDQLGDEGLIAYGITSRRLRENTLFTALLMEELAKPADEDPRTAYTIGLLRSIGKVGLDRLARDHAPGERFAAASRHLPLAHLLNLAANMVDKIGYGLPGETGYWLETDEVYRKAGVKMRDAKPYIDRAHFAFDRLLRSNF